MALLGRHGLNTVFIKSDIHRYGDSEFLSQEVLQGVFFIFISACLDFPDHFLSFFLLVIPCSFCFSPFSVFLQLFVSAKKEKKHFAALWLKIFNLARGEILRYQCTPNDHHSLAPLYSQTFDANPNKVYIF